MASQATELQIKFHFSLVEMENKISYWLKFLPLYLFTLFDWDFYLDNDFTLFQLFEICTQMFLILWMHTCRYSIDGLPISSVLTFFLVNRHMLKVSNINT